MELEGMMVTMSYTNFYCLYCLYCPSSVYLYCVRINN